MAKQGFSISTIKSLFALSCNACAYPGCEERLTSPEWEQVNAEIAHIAGEKPGSARYDAEMTTADRQHHSNLILLCPNHHKLIDRLDPTGHPTETIIGWKATHEQHCSKPWADEDTLTELAHQLLIEIGASKQAGVAVTGAPRLIVRQQGDKVWVENVGGADALSIEVKASNDAAEEQYLSFESGMASLPRDGQLQVGVVARAMGDQGTPMLAVTWTDSDGVPYSNLFPVN